MQELYTILQGCLRSGPTLVQFIKYCISHPHERFWQALRNWSDYGFVNTKTYSGEERDTFYWEGRRHDEKS